MLIKNDLFKISKRIKKIDKNYFILFNKLSQNFEVHYRIQKGGTFCFVAGKALDKKTLDKTLLTSAKFFKTNLKKMNMDNEILECKKEEENSLKRKEKLNAYLKCVEKYENFDFSKINTSKWF